MTGISTIVGIVGSLRAGSVNRQLLGAAAQALPPGYSWQQWNGLAAVPPFSEDLEDGPAPPAVAELRRTIHGSGGLLIATPEYNGSIPGQLKNALDWASRPYRDSALSGVPVAVIGASPSPHGAASAQADLRRVLGRAGADVLDAELVVAHAFRQFDESGRLLDARLADRLTAICAELAGRVDNRIGDRIRDRAVGQPVEVA